MEISIFLWASSDFWPAHLIQDLILEYNFTPNVQCVLVFVRREEEEKRGPNKTQKIWHVVTFDILVRFPKKVAIRLPNKFDFFGTTISGSVSLDFISVFISSHHFSCVFADCWLAETVIPNSQNCKLIVAAIYQQFQLNLPATSWCLALGLYLSKTSTQCMPNCIGGSSQVS